MSGKKIYVIQFEPDMIPDELLGLADNDTLKIEPGEHFDVSLMHDQAVIIYLPEKRVSVPWRCIRAATLYGWKDE